MQALAEKCGISLIQLEKLMFIAGGPSDPFMKNFNNFPGAFNDFDSYSRYFDWTIHPTVVWKRISAIETIPNDEDLSYICTRRAEEGPNYWEVMSLKDRELFGIS